MLIAQKEIPETSPAWHHTVLHDLSLRLEDEQGFPCIFSKNAFARGLVKLCFVEDNLSQSLRQLADDLRLYVKLSDRWDGNLGTAYPLVVAFSQNAIQSQSLEDYHAFGWWILQQLHDFDEKPWPEGVSTDPHHPYWSMCFHGMQIFVNMSCPAHEQRRSRNLGSHLLFIINPRERFDVVAGDTDAGRKVRANIRSRIEKYDQQSHCPQLGSFVAGEIEWWQYGITDVNTTDRADKCPFRSNT
ncbi:YqcI/YcgG family protein [Yoonia sp. BS5-3]|uniref:YqcI/YcgG family protein n=1 Tax=Yoonia phaeophyticola TaxID=3137369 RepID=A0ABZ2V3J0_9RHOB